MNAMPIGPDSVPIPFELTVACPHFRPSRLGWLRELPPEPDTTA